VPNSAPESAINAEEIINPSSENKITTRTSSSSLKVDSFAMVSLIRSIACTSVGIAIHLSMIMQAALAYLIIRLSRRDV